MLTRIGLLGVVLVGSLYAGEVAAQGAGEAASAPMALKLIMRWAHILAAISMLGGTLFMRFVLLPSIGKTLPPENAKELRTAVVGRWRKLVMGLIAALLVSGLYNYLAVTRHAHGPDSIYPMLFGIKFLLSMGVFGLASILVSGRDRPSKIRANAGVWMLVLVAMGVGVVLLAGYMKVMP